MAIGTCDNCSRENVPVSHLEGTYCGDTTQCFLCQGDSDPDPYGELLQIWHPPIIVDLGPRHPDRHSEPFAKRHVGRMRRKTRLFRVAEKMQAIGSGS